MAPPKINRDVLAMEYGFALSVLNSHPELKRLFDKAVANTWDPSRFVAGLRGTKWFKQTSDTARQWTMLKASDPATARRKTAEHRASLRDSAAALGVTLSKGQLDKMTNNAIMFGWTTDQTRDSIAKYYDYSASTPQAGLAGQTVDKMKEISHNYLVPISNATIDSWTRKTLAGSATVADYEEYAKKQAVSLFPTMKDAINGGMTVQEYVDPYRQVAASQLEINPAEIDFMDPKWRASIETVDPATGKRAPMSLGDWTNTVKSDPVYGWDKTNKAAGEAAAFTTKLAGMFGMV